MNITRLLSSDDLQWKRGGGAVRDFQQNPFIVIWELTRACQLKCLHCRAEAQYHRDPCELTLEEGKKLTDDIYAMDQPLLVFTGGGPDVYDIAKYAIDKGLRVSMTPSATPNVTKDAIRKAKEVGLARWAFSLDGPTAEIHDHFRGTSGSFDLKKPVLRCGLLSLWMSERRMRGIYRKSSRKKKYMKRFVRFTG